MRRSQLENVHRGQNRHACVGWKRRNSARSQFKYRDGSEFPALIRVPTPAEKPAVQCPRGSNRSRGANRLAGLALAGLITTWFASIHFVAAQPPAADARPAPANSWDSPAQPPPPERIERWIQDLGNDAYAVRQEASERLLEAGEAAQVPLAKLAEGTDPETRTSARRLLAIIERTEFRRKVDAFAADVEGKQGRTLPGWNEFQKLVGSDLAARSLFVDMQRQEGPLIAAVLGKSDRKPESLWEARLQQLTRWEAPYGGRNVPPALGSCAAMLFLGSLDSMNVTDTDVSQLAFLLQRPPLTQLTNQDATPTPLRKLALAWLVECPNRSDGSLLQRINVISSIGLSDGLPFALRIISNDPLYMHVQPLTKGRALLVVAQFGSRKNVDDVEPLLEDSTICISLQQQLPGKPPLGVQVRDVALVTLLSLTEQSPSDYGYLNVHMATPRSYQLQSIFRENDQQRAEAIAKWRQWRAAHK